MNLRKGNTWKDLAIALSLANLCLLRIWSQSLTYSPSDTYLMKHPPLPAAYYAAILNVVCLGVLFWLVSLIVRKFDSPGALRAREIVFLLSMLVPLNALREVASRQMPYFRGTLIRVAGELGAGIIIGACAIAFVAAVSIWSSKIVPAVRQVLLVLLAFVPVTIAQAFWNASHYDATAFVDGARAADTAERRVAGPRVLWIIFDELDYRLLFDERPPGVRVPEFDSLRNHALHATRAYPPPGGATIIAIPSLITGRLFHSAVAVDTGTLMLTEDGSGARVDWKSQGSVFAKARELGCGTAVVGWYHPYCRILNSVLDRCFWSEMPMMHNSMGSSLSELMPNQLRSLFETSLLSPFGQSLTTRAAARNYNELLSRTLEVASDPKIGLALFHLPVPHSPHFYNRVSRTFDLANSPVRGYLDSMELTDITLGAIRDSLGRNDLWNRTVVLVSADHSYRSADALGGRMDRRVPFMVSFPAQQQGLVFDTAISTLLTHDLVLAILRGELRSPKEAETWLSRNATRHPIGHQPI
jgi:hypothetical protein